MSFKFLNEGQSGNIQEFTPIDTFIDPVSKIRVSNPSNLIDTDFEYGLQPTKWETVELINNTPAFFSKGGDTTIPDITGITTNAGTREITVTTAFPHNLAVGIPIRVAGTKSVTADGSYIINATPTLTTFTYLSRANQTDTISIFDLYSSIITGEFFQGSQISISDAEGITTDGQGPISTLTVKTENKHGFGPNTPFYFLNLNSTISQEFEAQNTASVSFDPTNSATAQSFDGSNTLLQTPIDLSNSATTATQPDNITSTSPTNSTFTISINAANEVAWSNISVGDPLYYNVVAGGGFFQASPRGVVFIKDVSGVNAGSNVATFQVSELPDGDALPVLANTQGFFQVADQARTFAGNNVNEETQIDITVEVGQEFVFDGGNQGYDGDSENPPSNVGTVVGYTGTSMTLFTAEGNLDYYEGAMLRYDTTDAAATGLVDEGTYFVTSFAPGQSAGLFTMSIAELPDGAPINISGGSGTQTFSKIGVSIDKDIVHVRDSNFQKDDMLEYTYPVNGTSGNFGSDFEQKFYFVDIAYDEHNYRLSEDVGFRPIVATGGNSVTEIYDQGRVWKVHRFTSVGTSNFVIEDSGKEGEVEYLVVAGGGAGGLDNAGGGGAGGMLTGFINVSAQSYPVVVGAGGLQNQPYNYRGNPGANSSAFGLTSIGGGGGGGGDGGGSQSGTNFANSQVHGGNGGSGGGGASEGGNGAGGTGVAGPPRQGFNGGNGAAGSGGGGGGANGAGTNASSSSAPGNGGAGRSSSITGTTVFYAGGGGGATENGTNVTSGGLGGNGGGGRGGAGNRSQLPGAPNTGGGGGGEACCQGFTGGNGGSGIVVVRYPITAEPSGSFIQATGGSIQVIQQDGILYAVHSFTSLGSSTFEVVGEANIQENNELEYLIVAGGGGGGNDNAGGGGAGGLLQGTFQPSEQSYTIIVGDGGNGGLEKGHATRGGGNSDNGQNSSAFGFTAIGGGRGGSADPGLIGGGDGGSGGGRIGNTDGSTKIGQGTPGQGNNGGGASGGGGGGGGGGAGQAGQSGSGQNGGNGGNGLYIDWADAAGFGENGYFAGGGGAGNENEVTHLSTGGLGGGGNANLTQASVQPGQANTGGGGGGGTHTQSAGRKGGSGIVLVRYPIGVVA
jgi:hypothetical protein